MICGHLMKSAEGIRRIFNGVLGRIPFLFSTIVHIIKQNDVVRCIQLI